MAPTEPWYQPFGVSVVLHEEKKTGDILNPLCHILKDFWNNQYKLCAIAPGRISAALRQRVTTAISFIYLI